MQSIGQTEVQHIQEYSYFKVKKIHIKTAVLFQSEVKKNEDPLKLNLCFLRQKCEGNSLKKGRKRHKKRASIARNPCLLKLPNLDSNQGPTD